MISCWSCLARQSRQLDDGAQDGDAGRHQHAKPHREPKRLSLDLLLQQCDRLGELGPGQRERLGELGPGQRERLGELGPGQCERLIEIRLGDEFGHDKVSARGGVRFGLVLQDTGIAQPSGTAEGLKGVDHRHARHGGWRAAAKGSLPPLASLTYSPLIVSLHARWAWVPGPARICSAMRPAFCRIAASILAAMSGLLLRKPLAFSRPWPMRWES